MDVCEFSYINSRTNLPTTALGIERSWDNLKAEFNRSGSGIPGATYYKTISFQGPQLFAVVGENAVFYHDKGEWHPYLTAINVRFGQMNIAYDQPRATTADESPVFPDTFSQQDKPGLEPED
jgi:hypothetical protein